MQISDQLEVALIISKNLFEPKSNSKEFSGTENHSLSIKAQAVVSAQVADHVTTIPEFLCSDPTKGGPSLGSGSKARAQRPWPALAGPGRPWPIF